MFTYSVDVDRRWQRWCIRGLEALTGARRLQKLYRQRDEYLKSGLNPWTTAVRLLDLDVQVRGGSLDGIPASGPLVVVANHPYGVVDGMVICHLLTQVRRDFAILIHSALRQVEEIRPYLLPIDFRQTRDAMSLNLRSRAAALELLKAGGAVVIFPSGAVSTAQRPFAKAVDAPWQTFAAKLVRTTGATVLPVYFRGQNSWLFQVASRVSLTLRLSLLAHEARNKIGRDLEVTIGHPISPTELDHLGCRRALVDRLRDITYGLEATMN